MALNGHQLTLADIAALNCVVQSVIYVLARSQEDPLQLVETLRQISKALASNPKIEGASDEEMREFEQASLARIDHILNGATAAQLKATDKN